MTARPIVSDPIPSLRDEARRLNDASPQDIIAWALERYRSRIVLACSFGGPSGVVALDMVLTIDPTTPIYYLDTGVLFKETYDLVGRVSERYGIEPIAVASPLSLDEQRRVHGEALWNVNPDACCAIRKVEPQRAFLREYDAWITGLRRDQAPTRSSVPVVQWDAQFELVKVNPFAHWDERMTWAYIRAHDLPYNALHDRGYPSLGCTHCTRAVAPGEDLRAGRWADRDKVECGLHVAPSVAAGGVR
jgi:phosphoadenosine phosphosulfate reductase